MSKQSMLFGACAVWMLAASATAQPVDRRTFYTFKTPVEMPGATLPPGKYMFRFINPESSSGVIQVVSDADKKVWGMFFTIPTQRPDLPEKPEIRFMETAAGTPSAIKTMWYIGERTGRELIYPREQARRLAQSTRQPVLTTRGASAPASASADQPKSDELSRVSPTGEDTQVANNAAQAPSGAAQPGENVPDSYSLPPQQMARAEAPARTALPKTASHTPAVGLTGLALLGAGLGLAAFRRTRSRQAL